MDLLELFTRTLDVTLPVFAMVFIGIALKRLGWIDSAFISTALVSRVQSYTAHADLSQPSQS
ncbi:hypothetical protein HAALTHF_30040n [Vreelandella aquamarina]|nr:hypothetical protein HAALTHF_30040n [Halomonas axialensis]